MNKLLLALPALGLLAGCGSNSGDGAAKQQLKIVGSSTVYPFTTAVAEQFQRDNPNVTAVVESTGTGAGMKLFCGGVGGNFPDIDNASRQIKKSEYDSCVAAGVKNVIEVASHRVRRDGRHVPLGPTEFRLLRNFLEHPGRVFSRERLLDVVWAHNADVGLRTVDVHVPRLRQALNAGGAEDLFRTVRGSGYAVDSEA